MKKANIICIIDDDPIFTFTTKKLLKTGELCNNIVIYNNGKEALNGLKQSIKSNENIPNLILLDLNMPIMDGWQFLDEFVKIKCQKKIILYIVSSSINPSDLEKAKEYKQVTNYLVKPISREALEEVIENIDL